MSGSICPVAANRSYPWRTTSTFSCDLAYSGRPEATRKEPGADPPRSQASSDHRAAACLEAIESGTGRRREIHQGG